MKARHNFVISLQAIQMVIDRRLNRYYLPLTIALFITVTYSYITRSIFNADWHAWAVGDWLINYAAGFVRRGLLGELILRLSDATNFKPNILVILTQVSLWIAFVFLFFIRLRNKQISFYFLLIIFSPAFILFYGFDGAAVGRKEIILMVLYGAWLCVIDKRSAPTVPQTLLFSTLIFFATLMHELFFFYSLYFMFAVWVNPSYHDQKWPVVFFIPLASFAAMLLIFFSGGSLLEPEICQRLASYAPDPQICLGILNSPELGLSESVLLFVSKLIPLKTLAFAFSVLLPIVPVALFMYGADSPRRAPKQVILLCALLYVCSLPLFVIASDWGRFIHIHVVLLALTMTLLLKSGQQSSIVSTVAGKAALKLQALWRIRPGLCVAGALILLTPLWRLKHCCTGYVDVLWPVRLVFGVL
jgi:hypothetical protein